MHGLNFWTRWRKGSIRISSNRQALDIKRQASGIVIITPAIKHDKGRHAGLDPTSSLFLDSGFARMTLLRCIIAGEKKDFPDA